MQHLCRVSLYYLLTQNNLRDGDSIYICARKRGHPAASNRSFKPHEVSVGSVFTGDCVSTGFWGPQGASASWRLVAVIKLLATTHKFSTYY